MIYQLYYPKLGITQIKRLIPHSEYTKVRDLTDDKEFYKQYKLLGNGIEWFTEQSPYYQCLHNGGLFICNGISIPCLVTPLHS